MNNSLLTKLSDYGLTLMSEQIRNNATLFALIGTSVSNDPDLIAALEDNDLNNNMTYGLLSNRNWIGYEGLIHNSYYDSNNFLTFDINIPAELELNIYVYGIAIIDTSSQVKKIISITRSPSIFNKVKNTSSTFSIKLTFGQEDINSQFRDDIHNSKFQDNKFICLFSGSLNNNIIQLDQSLNIGNIEIGIKLKGDGIEENTVIIDNEITDKTLTKNQLRISKNLNKDVNNSALFKIDTFFSQDSFVTRGEFNQWQENHNHNKIYYRINETVKNSLQLNGYESSHYATSLDLIDIKKELNEKISRAGGKLEGKLSLDVSKFSTYKDSELIPLIELKQRINDLREIINDEDIRELKNIVYDNTGRKESLITLNKNNLVYAINELSNYIGNIYSIYPNEPGFKDISKIIKNILLDLGDTSNNSKSISELIKIIQLNKIEKRNGTFLNSPSVDEELDISLKSNENRLITLKNMKSYVDNKVGKEKILDLSLFSKDFMYPIVLNELNEGNYTDSIIINEKIDDIDSVMKLEVKGNGSSSNKYAPSLKVYHSNIGVDKIVGKIEMFSTSSAIVIYLRGGFRYRLFQNSFHETEPVIVQDSYRLQNSVTTVSKYNCTVANGDSNRLKTGFWLYNDLNSISLTGDIIPHMSNSVI